MPQHLMTVEQRTDDEILFVCTDESCLRSLLFGPQGKLTIINPGDAGALHQGASAPDLVRFSLGTS